MANDNLFWNQMLMRSDSIVDIDPNAPDAMEQVRAQLGTITEQFDRAFDPADQFEEYVTVALCQALQRALTPKVARPVCKVSVQNKLRNTAPAAPTSLPALGATPPQTPLQTSSPQTQPSPQPKAQVQPQPQTPPKPKSRPKKRGGKR